MNKLITTFCLVLLSLAGSAQNCFWHENMETIDSVTSSANSNPPTLDWNANTRLSHSGVQCDSSVVGASNVHYLEMGPIDFLGLNFITLSFWHICRIDFFDAATVEVSNDGGSNWTQLTCAQHDSTLPSHSTFCGQGNIFSSATYLDWDPANPATVATNAMWKFERFDLSSSLGGQMGCLVRFKLADLSNPGSGGYPGWYIDDICIDASPCELNPPVISFINPLQNTVYNLGPYNVFADILDGSGLLSQNLVYTIDGLPVGGDTVAMTFVSGNTYQGTIPAVNDSQVVCYYIYAVDNSGCNNSTTQPSPPGYCFTASVGVGFPYCDNFDLTQLWTDSSSGAGSQWQLGAPTSGWPNSAHSAPNIWEIALNSTYLNNTDANLYSPIFDFSGAFNANIDLWINSQCENSWDGARIDFDTIGGAGSTWNVLGGVGTGTNWYNDAAINSTLQPGWTGTSQAISGQTGWFPAQHTLSMLGGCSYVQLRFNFGSDASVIQDGFAIDDICITVPSPQDAGISAIIQPTSQFPADTCVPVIVTLKNFGSQPITSTDITYVQTSGLGGPQTQTITWTGFLAPGATENDTLPCFNVPTGAFCIQAYTTLLNDGNHFNDSTSTCGVGIPVDTPTVCDDFESGNLGWLSSPATGGWALGAPTPWAAYSPSNSWNTPSPYPGNAFDTLYTPIYSMAAAINPSFSFYQNRNTEVGSDGFFVEFELDNTGNWQRLGVCNDINGINWYNQCNLNFTNLPAWDGTSNGWTKSVYFLGAIAPFPGTNSMRFRFIFTSNFANIQLDGVSIDNYCISIPCANDVGVLSVNSYNQAQGGTLPAGTLDSVQVSLHNYGTSTQSTVNVWYQIVQGATVLGPFGPYTWNGSLATSSPGWNSASFVLPATYTVPSGSYQIVAWTSLAGDCDALNDTLNANGNGIPVLTPTACDDFEGANQGWSASPNVNGWQLGSPVAWTAHSPTNSWNIINGFGNDEDTLYTPIYNMAAAVNPSLNFWQNRNTEVGNDGFWVEYQINNTGPWQRLGVASAGNNSNGNAVNWYNQANLNFSAQPAWDGTSNGWVKSSFFLSAVAAFPGTNYMRFRFIYTSNFVNIQLDGVSMDDFCVSNPCATDVGPVSGGSYTNWLGGSPAAGVQDSITVTLHNYGSTNQTGFSITYQIDSAGFTIFTSTPYVYNGPALTTNAPGWNATIVLPQYYTVPAGGYQITIWVTQAGDCDATNDTTHNSAVGVPIILVDYNNPYCDDFESGNVGWTVSLGTNPPGDPGSVWELGLPAVAPTNTTHSGANAWDINLNSGYTNNANVYLTSPIFDFTNAADAGIDFWNNFSTEQNWDGVRIEASVNNGPWTHFGAPQAGLPAGTALNWYNCNNINSNPGVNGAWCGTLSWQHSIWYNVNTGAPTLPFNGAPRVQFRFQFTSDASVIIQGGYTFDDFCLTVPVPLTTTPVAITDLPTTPHLNFPGQTICFRTTIKNDGTTAINSTAVQLVVDNNFANPVSLDTVTYATPLAPGAAQNYQFSNCTTLSPGSHTICAVTSYPNASADLKPINDTICYTILVFDSATITNQPKCYDFESGPTWVTLNSINLRPTSSWTLGLPAKPTLNTAHSGTQAWITGGLTLDYTAGDTSSLFSPLFVVNGSLVYTLSFWTQFLTEKNEDGGTIDYSTDYGVTWHQFGDNQDPNWMNTYSITALQIGAPGIFPWAGWSGNGSGWAQRSHDFCLGMLGTQNIVFRFRFNSDFSVNDEGWEIDDVCITPQAATCPLAVEEINEEFSVLQNIPNPFSDVTTISFVIKEKGATSLQILDITGKLVSTPLNEELTPGEYTINIKAGDLASGVYFYALKHNDARVVKKMVVAK